MSAARIPPELLYDSAERLRRTDQLLDELLPQRVEAPVLAPRLESDPLLMPPLPEILQRAYGEIVHVLENLGRSRAILEQAAVDRLHRTNAKLREVSSATELATTSILENLERGLELVDDLDADAAGAPVDAGEARRGELRDVLHAMLAQLQFQDITSQQLSYATSLLDDLEERLRAIAEVIDASVLGVQHAGEHDLRLGEVHGQHFDPAATAADATARQALADQIFA